MKTKTPSKRLAPLVALEQTTDAISQRIHVLRGERVMLDEDLADLYGVATGHLNEAVRRNAARFPPDFAFRTTAEEVANLESQFAISSRRWGGRRSPPRAFTEEGVAMLSSVLRSPRAVAVNILVMRAFVQLRRAQGQYAELRQHIEELARRVEGHDELLSEVLAVLDALEETPAPPPRPLGFRPRSTTGTSSVRYRKRTTRGRAP